MPVYIMASIAIEDPEEYGKYQDGFLEVFEKYQGQLLAVSDEPEVVEGDWPFTRAVLLRFPDEAEARRWYESTEYQAIAQHRFRASTSSIVAVQGLPD